MEFKVSLSVSKMEHIVFNFSFLHVTKKRSPVSKPALNAVLFHADLGRIRSCFMQLWLLNLSYLNCVSRNGQCIAYKSLAVRLVCTVCSIPVPVFKELIESSHNEPWGWDSVQGASLHYCLGAWCSPCLALQDWCCHRMCPGTAARHRRQCQALESPKHCQKKSKPPNLFQVCWRLGGKKWLGQSKTKEGVKGSGKDGEGEVEHIHELQLPLAQLQEPKGTEIFLLFSPSKQAF